MVAHKQIMVKLIVSIRVIAPPHSHLGIGFVGDGKIQAEDARIMDPLIDAAGGGVRRGRSAILP